MAIGITPLENRSILRLSGNDIYDFLQGLITNDIHKLKAAGAIYAALLTPQGKFMFDMIIVKSADNLLLDIEKQRDKIARIASKFIDYEFQYLQKTSDCYTRRLTVIWGIKESLYKLFATPGMLFKEHFLVIPFMINDDATVAWIDYEDRKYRYEALFLEFEDFTCAYVVA